MYKIIGAAGRRARGGFKRMGFKGPEAATAEIADVHTRSYFRCAGISLMILQVSVGARVVGTGALCAHIIQVPTDA
jgi:hypothetical protein